MITGTSRFIDAWGRAGAWLDTARAAIVVANKAEDVKNAEVERKALKQAVKGLSRAYDASMEAARAAVRDEDRAVGWDLVTQVKSIRKRTRKRLGHLKSQGQS